MPEATRPSSITCAHCGVEKKVGRSGPIPTYCSANCRARVKDERARKDGRYERSLAEARRRTAERQAENARPCPYCGVAMTHPRRVQCGGDECRRRHAADRMREWSQAYKAEHGVWPRHHYPESQRAAYRRRRQKHGHWRQQYPERAAAYDARRRALVAQARTDEVFAPIDVHARDGWTCQLCLKPIDQGIAWPDPMSPSVDHIIPLSKGGTHALSNVQSAHLGCNSSKSNRGLIDVVMRIGQANR
jgi:hypothetical protein